MLCYNLSSIQAMRGASVARTSKMSSMLLQNMDENKNNSTSKMMTRSVNYDHLLIFNNFLPCKSGGGQDISLPILGAGDLIQNAAETDPRK